MALGCGVVIRAFREMYTFAGCQAVLSRRAGVFLLLRLVLALPRVITERVTPNGAGLACITV